MTGHAELIREIDKLPSRYIGEVFDFVGYLQHKNKGDDTAIIDSYKAMAADTEREQEAREWCNSYFGPVQK